MSNLFKKGFASVALASAMASGVFAGDAANIDVKHWYSVMGDDGNQSISSSFETTFEPASAVQFVSSNNVVGNNTASINLQRNRYLFVAKKDFDDAKSVFKTGKVDALAVIKTPFSQFSGGTDGEMHAFKANLEPLGFSFNGKVVSFSVINTKPSVVATFVAGQDTNNTVSFNAKLLNGLGFNGKGLSFSVIHAKDSVVANFVAGQAINEHIVQETNLAVSNIGKGLSFSVHDNKPSVVAISAAAIQTGMTNTNNIDAKTSLVATASSSFAKSINISSVDTDWDNVYVKSDENKKDMDISYAVNDKTNQIKMSHTLTKIKTANYMMNISNSERTTNDMINMSNINKIENNFVLLTPLSDNYKFDALAFNDGDKTSGGWLIAA